MTAIKAVIFTDGGKNFNVNKIKKQYALVTNRIQSSESCNCCTVV